MKYMKQKQRELKSGYMYILICGDGSYYVGSTNNLKMRMDQHNRGEGSNYTSKRLPVKLVYKEWYESVGHAYLREKQIQKWNREKKEALIKKNLKSLHTHAACRNKSHSRNFRKEKTKRTLGRNRLIK